MVHSTTYELATFLGRIVEHWTIDLNEILLIVADPVCLQSCLRERQQNGENNVKFDPSRTETT